MFTTKMKKVVSKVLAGMMAIAMVVTMLPEASATAAETSDALDNLVLGKEARLEDDGTYTIELSAYAKGNVSTETVKKVVPADIILVLDQSGSMVQETITGIPSNTYTEVTDTLTNAQVAEGSYYYEVNGTYYPVQAVKETVSVETRWVGQDGNFYTEDQLSYSWSRKSDGQVYYTASPFVTSSLKTYTRTHTSFLSLFYYVNDADSSDTTTKSTSAASARTNFTSAKKTDSTTVEFHNDGAPAAGDTDADDPYYVAAVYTAVTKQEVKTYQYTYFYTNEDGNKVIIGSSVGAETDTCTISPLYVRDTKDGTRLEALQYAAESFIEDIYASAEKNNVDHRVAVVGFASDEYTGTSSSYYYSNSELFIGETQYNYAAGGTKSTYNTDGNLADDHYDEAFQSVLSTEGYQNLLDSVDNLAGYGGTHPSVGFDMANGIFEANNNEYTKADGTTGTRSRMIIFLTDGNPGDSNNEYDSTEADETYTSVNISKTTYKADVYTVAVLDSTPDTESDTFLKTVSSSNSYTLATSTSDLEGFFDTVDESINNTTTTVTLSEDAILVDLLSEYFVVPTDFTIENNVTVQVAKHHGYNSFGTPSAAPAEVTAEVSLDSEGNIQGILVSGFNYISADNMVTTDESGGSVKANGNKLVVTVTGLLAKDEAANNLYIDTNKDSSAIWDTDENGEYGIVKAFEKPHTMLAKKLFVLDYAKEAPISVYNATKVDSASDGLFSKVSDSNTSLTGVYGNVAVTEADGLTYTPSTMQWSGLDTFYALGKDSSVGDSKTGNIWSKVSVIPANNVYYEDDFVTSTTAGTVGIEYAGTWAVTGTSSNNQESANTEIHGGWQNSDLADDTTFTDGTAHVSSTSGSTATFTFTGTGVDIYSYTDMNSGVICADLYYGALAASELANNTKALTQSYIIDNYAASGEYYQIPTASFMDLDYGTYTVQITVYAKSATDTRSTYYLDGIRVYNPLLEDETISEAYGAETSAWFTSVRNLLLDATTLYDGTTAAETDGVVFIDQIEDETGITTNAIGTYETYGPKNEVYLSKGQAIAFRVGVDQTYSIGLKAMTGNATTAKVTYGDAATEYTIASTADLYYELIPNEDGLVVIQNTGDNLLSITKLKATGDVAVEEVSVMMLMSYMDEFDTLEVVDTDAEPEEDIVPDVEIEDDTTDEEVEEETPVQENPSAMLQKLIKNIFDSLRSWFRR